MDNSATGLLKEHERLKAGRSTWNSHWQEVATLLWPDMKDMFSSPSNRQDGEKRLQKQYESAPVIALDRFVSVLDSLLTPRSSRWHGLRPIYPEISSDIEVRRYFEFDTDVVFYHRYASNANFQTHQSLVWRSVGAFGIGWMFIDEFENGSPRYKYIPLNEMYYGEDHSGNVVKVHREFKLTPSQALTAFGELDEKTRKELSTKGEDDKQTFVHCVYQRVNAKYGDITNKNMPFVSTYVWVEAGRTIREGGYRSMPYICARYRKVNGESYARGPGIDVLPNIKAVNIMKRDSVGVLHRQASPVYLVPEDGVIDTESLVPGCIAYGGLSAGGEKLVKTLDVPQGQTQEFALAMEAEMAVINDAFLVSIFQILQDNPQMTATEVLERVKEKGILLSSLGRIQDDYLVALVERELLILDSNRMLPPPPPLLVEAGGEYEVDFTSPLNKTEKASEASGLLRTMESLMSVANMLQDPSIMDVINKDKAARFLAETNSVPANIMATDDEMAAVRQGRNQQQSVQSLIQAAPSAAALIKAQQP